MQNAREQSCCVQARLSGGSLVSLRLRCALLSAHRSVVSAERAKVLIGGDHAARPRHLDRVGAPGHAVSVRRCHPLLLADQDDAQLRSPIA